MASKSSPADDGDLEVPFASIGEGKEESFSSLPALPWKAPPAWEQNYFGMTALWMFVPPLMWLFPIPLGWECMHFLPVSLCLSVVVGLTSMVHWLDYQKDSIVQRIDMLTALVTFISMNVECWIHFEGDLLLTGAALGLFMMVLICLDLLRPTWDGHDGFIFHSLLRGASLVYMLLFTGRPQSVEEPIGWAVLGLAFGLAILVQTCWLLARPASMRWGDAALVLATIAGACAAYSFSATHLL